MRDLIRRYRICRLSFALYIFVLVAPAYAQLQPVWEITVGPDSVETLGGATLLRTGSLFLSVSNVHGTSAYYHIDDSGLHSIGHIEPEYQYPAGLELSSHGIAAVLSQQDVSSQLGLIELAQQQFQLSWILNSSYRSSYLHYTDFYDRYFYAGGVLNRSQACVEVLNRNGNTIWQDVLSVSEQEAIDVNDVAMNVVGNIYMPIIYSYNNTVRLLLRTYDVDGLFTTQQVYPAPPGLLMYARSCDIAVDGNVYLSGVFSLAENSVSSIVAFTPDGELIHSYGDGEFSKVITYTSDGGYFSVEGSFQYEPLTIRRYDASYTLLWENSFIVDDDNFITFYDSLIILDPSGYFYLIGSYEREIQNEYERNVFVAKFTGEQTDLALTVNNYGNDSSVPAPGRFYWHGELTNNTDSDITTDVWVIVRGPDGYPSEPLRIWSDITIPANSIYEADLRQNVPANAASGEYNYVVRAGAYSPDDPQHTIQAYFPITVTGGTDVVRDPPRMHGIVAAPFDEPAQVEITPEFKTTK